MSFEQNQTHVLSLFSKCQNKEEVYQKLIDLGQKLHSSKTYLEEDLVKGCQSTVYLTCTEKQGKCYFEATADALISKGLVYILLLLFNGLTPQEIVQAKPNFIEKLHLETLLSPSRANGLAAVLLKIKQLAMLKL
ncbi:MAG: Cysteine desulfuration protein SufE [Chlamydiae bacterium]|nr:Cysteine desulfuration protein SufE [Chlamydiota bacterium]